MNITPCPFRMIRLLRWLAGLAVVGGLAFAGIHAWRESRGWVKTDNAYLEGPIHPLAARLAGTVEEVLVEENERVKPGQVLIRLDPRDAEIRRGQNQAKLKEAGASVLAAEVGVDCAEADVRLSDVAVEKAGMDLERMQQLSSGQRMAVAGQELDHAQSAYDSARAALAASRSTVALAKARVVVARSKQASAAEVLKESVLQCEYTTITAPVAGRVGRRNVEPGQPVIPAQPLLALIGDDLWLTANFKETQISLIKPGQPVWIRFDALPEREWPGTVESLSPASGSSFALLPPDNATGNFTRVVQRLPVRIRIDSSARNGLGQRLAPGLSAKVRVRVGSGSNEKTTVPTPATLTRR